MARIGVHTFGQQLFRVGLTHRLGRIADDFNRAMRQFLSAFVKHFQNARAFCDFTQFWNSFRPDMRQAIDRHWLQIATFQGIDTKLPCISHMLGACLWKIVLQRAIKETQR